jgi:hypothetical protein
VLLNTLISLNYVINFSKQTQRKVIVYSLFEDLMGLPAKQEKNYQGCVEELSTILGTIQTILTNFKPVEKASFSMNR